MRVRDDSAVTARWRIKEGGPRRWRGAAGVRPATPGVRERGPARSSR